VCISLTEKKQNDNIFHLLIFFHLFLISFLFQQDLLRKMIFCIF
jgi:cytochrome c oxidase assembly factor CtaG